MASYRGVPGTPGASRQLTPVRSAQYLGNSLMSQLTPNTARKEEKLPHLRSMFLAGAVEKVRLRFCDHVPSYGTEDGMVEPQHIVLSQQLAKGSYGTVHKGTYQSGKPIAIKVEDFPSSCEGQANLLAELTILKVLAHDRVVEHLGTGYIPTPAGPKVVILMELCRNGAMREALGCNLQWKLKTRIAADIADGIHYLHSMNIIHRDIKTTNVLIDSSWRAKLCDFSFAIHVDSTVKSDYIYGTDEFMAPEIAMGESFDTQADMFSFGVLLAEVIAEREPNEQFLKRTARDFFAMDVDQIRQAVLDGCPRSLTELCVQCCAQEPEFRPSADVTSDWLHSILNDLHEEIELPRKRPAKGPLSPRREGNVVFPRRDASSVRTTVTTVGNATQGMDLHGRVALLEMYTQQLLAENARLKHEVQQLTSMLANPRPRLLSARSQLSISAKSSPVHTSTFGFSATGGGAAAQESLALLAERVGVLETKVDSLSSGLVESVQGASSDVPPSTEEDDVRLVPNSRPQTVSTRRRSQQHHQNMHKRTPTFPMTLMNRSMSHESIVINSGQTPPSAQSNGNTTTRHHRQSSTGSQHQQSLRSHQVQPAWGSRRSLHDTQRSDHARSSPLLIQPPTPRQASIGSPFASDPPSPLMSTQLLLSDEEEYVSSNDEEEATATNSPRKIRASLGNPAAGVSLYGALNWEEQPPKDSRKSMGDSPSNRIAFAKRNSSYGD